MVLVVEQPAKRQRSDHQSEASVGRGERCASPGHAPQQEAHRLGSHYPESPKALCARAGCRCNGPPQYYDGLIKTLTTNVATTHSKTYD